MRLPVTRKLQHTGAKIASKFFPYGPPYGWTQCLQLPSREVHEVLSFNWIMIEAAMGWEGPE